MRSNLQELLGKGPPGKFKTAKNERKKSKVMTSIVTLEFKQITLTRSVSIKVSVN